MPSNRWTPVGRIVKTHGLNGEVSVASAVGTSLSSLAGRRIWFVPPPESVRVAMITATRTQGRGELVSFDAVVDAAAAKDLVGCTMLVASDDLPVGWADVDESEDDYVDYSVSDIARGELGVIVETIVTGANDVWVIRGDLGDVLIPVIDDVVLSVDDRSRAIVVRLLPGLLEDS